MDGQVTVNGDNRNLQISVPPHIQGSVKMVATGGLHTLFLTHAGQVYTCGQNNRGQCDVGKISPCVQGRVKYVASGAQHSLLVTRDNQLQTLGRNQHQECEIPAEIQGKVATACAGFKHTVILTVDGHVHTCGDDEFDQCFVPDQVRSGGVVQIAAGEQHSVQLTQNGFSQASGKNQENQCNLPMAGFESIQGKIQSISAGGQHTLQLLRDGRVVGSGKNDYGQIEIDNSDIDVSDQGVTQGVNQNIYKGGVKEHKLKDANWYYVGRKVVNISAGYNHSLVIYNDGVVKGQGRSNEQQIQTPKQQQDFQNQFIKNNIKLPKIKPFKESQRESLRNQQKSLISEKENKEMIKNNCFGLNTNLKLNLKNKNIVNLNPLPIQKSILNLEDRNSNPQKSSPYRVQNMSIQNNQNSINNSHQNNYSYKYRNASCLNGNNEEQKDKYNEKQNNKSFNYNLPKINNDNIKIMRTKSREKKIKLPNLNAIKELESKIEQKTDYKQFQSNMNNLKYYNPNFSVPISPRSNILGITLGENKENKKFNRGDDSPNNIREDKVTLSERIRLLSLKL